jgi:glycosyltransferase involved in cell wall biosynthesis
MKLSIIIPAHNEEQRIRPMLDSYISYFNERYGENVEFLVIVNGSNDGTEHIVREYIERYGHIKMAVIPDRVGKGGALIRGFREASGDLVGFVDADGATPPHAFEDLVQNIGDAGCIIGSRWLPESNVTHEQPLRRRIISRIFNTLVRTLFGIKIHDTQCGAKLCTREAADHAVPRISSLFWAFDVDLLLHVRQAGYKIKEHPTTWTDIDGSKIRIFNSSYEMLLAIFRLRFYYSPLRPFVHFIDKVIGRKLYDKRIMQGRLVQQQKYPSGNKE